MIVVNTVCISVFLNLVMFISEVLFIVCREELLSWLYMPDLEIFSALTIRNLFLDVQAATSPEAIHVIQHIH